ncbi:MAG: ABC1 kinase family protein [Thermodesulfobacteriota bacterium]
MSKKKLVKSATSRMARLGSLAGRVGFSMATNTMANYLRHAENSDEQQSAVMMKNALRVKDALGELKGVPMKIGQMLSLHENLLPEEVTRVLQSLQQKAPSAPFEDIYEMIACELGDRFEQIEHIDRESLAAASIGQVHRAVLKDGRQIVFKVQYPGIDEVIRNDLKNLKGLLKTVFSMFTRMEIDDMWQEMKDRMLEELDYENEADNMRRMADCFAGDERVVIPEVFPELTTRHVLAMELVTGISPDDATGGHYSRALKDQWGKSLAGFILKGLFHHQFLHADPNLSNFSFRENGGIVVYDFGCMKDVPDALALGYVRLVKAVLEHNYPDMPEILKSMGVHRADGSPVPWQMIKDYADEIQKIVAKNSTYTFGEDGDIYKRLQALGQKYIDEFMTMVFSKDIIFIDRTFNGHFGNLGRLKARADWRRFVVDHIAPQFPDEAIAS